MANTSYLGGRCNIQAPIFTNSRIVSGQDVLHRIEAVSTNREDKPTQQIVITHCGEIKVVADEQEEKAELEKLEKQKQEAAASEQKVPI